LCHRKYSHHEIEPDEKIVEIEMERLREFRNHPFKVKADAQMLQLIESISKYGILNPLIVRPLPEGVYEIIAGHRRKYAAQHLGFRKMPVMKSTYEQQLPVSFEMESVSEETFFSS